MMEIFNEDFLEAAIAMEEMTDLDNISETSRPAIEKDVERYQPIPIEFYNDLDAWASSYNQVNGHSFRMYLQAEHLGENPDQQQFRLNHKPTNSINANHILEQSPIKGQCHEIESKSKKGENPDQQQFRLNSTSIKLSNSSHNFVQNSIKKQIQETERKSKFDQYHSKVSTPKTSGRGKRSKSMQAGEPVRKKSSSFRGVSFNSKSKKWKAVITYQNMQKFLGYFDNERDAALTYDVASQMHRGPHARLNFELPKEKIDKKIWRNVERRIWGSQHAPEEEEVRDES